MVTIRKKQQKSAKGGRKLSDAEKEAKTLADYKKFARWPKGTKTQVMHDRIWGGTYTIHKHNLAPLGRPPEAEGPRTKVYDPLHETLTPYALKQVIKGKSRSEVKPKKGKLTIPRGTSKRMFFLQLVRRLDKDGMGALREDVSDACVKMGISPRECEEFAEFWMDHGEMYEPNLRRLKVISDKPVVKTFPERGHGPAVKKASKTKTPKVKVKKASKVKTPKKRSSRREYDYGNYLNDLESYRRGEAEKALATHVRIEDIDSNLADRGYGDTRKNYRRTGAKTRYLAEMDEAYREFKQREDDFNRRF